MHTKAVEKYFFFGLLLATLVLTFLIFRPFWAVLTLGICFAIILHPLFAWFKKYNLREGLAALVTVIIFTLILFGPLLGIGAIVFDQSQELYKSISEQGSTGLFIDSIEDTVNQVLPRNVELRLEEKVSEFISFMSSNIAGIFTTTFSALFSLLLVLLSIYYFLKDGEKWTSAIVLLSPLSDKDDKKIISRLSRAVNAVVKGYLLIAVVQGILMGTGLWIFGIPSPALWGVVAAFASLLPIVGTAFVSVPAIIFLLISGQFIPALGLAIWAVIVVGLVDNFLSPYVVGRQTNIPPLLVLFSVLGGIAFLGPMGVLAGPLVISLLYTLISIYRNEFREQTVQ